MNNIPCINDNPDMKKIEYIVYGIFRQSEEEEKMYVELARKFKSYIDFYYWTGDDPDAQNYFVWIGKKFDDTNYYITFKIDELHVSLEQRFDLCTRN